MTVRILDWQEAQRTIWSNRHTYQPDTIPDNLRKRIEERFGEPLTPQQAVARILADVRTQGDQALYTWTQKLDGVELKSIEIPPEAWEDAYTRLSADLREALTLAAERIRAFHAQQPISSWQTNELGGMLGQRIVPLQRVGVYVPGGTAPLPSSLLMAAIPARIAGVDEVIVCTPPQRTDGTIADITLAAAHIAKIDRLFSLGGAQAIAAMAFGTESIPRVDKIVGAGGLFTTLAKQQVYGLVGLDGIYGPTETIVVADESANPAWVAADLLAQAEHDVLATAILLTPSQKLAQAVAEEITHQLPQLERAEIARQSLERRGAIVLTPDLETAIRMADVFAPEHLCLSVHNPTQWIDQIRNAGGIFLGEHSFEVLGDYVAGPSHIMPTGGTARFKGPLNVLDFVKVINLIGLSPEAAKPLCSSAARIAAAESLTAHQAAAEIRIEEERR